MNNILNKKAEDVDEWNGNFNSLTIYVMGYVLILSVISLAISAYNFVAVKKRYDEPYETYEPREFHDILIGSKCIIQMIIIINFCSLILATVVC